MRRAMDETDRRRQKQLAFNAAHGIVPRGVTKRIKDIIDGVYATGYSDSGLALSERKAAQQRKSYDAMSAKEVAAEIRKLESAMQQHAKNLEFEAAGRVRDQLFRLKEQLFGAAPK
jgi:excinuclease ABC subunit B